MLDEKDAWKHFTESGSVQDYLQYVNACRKDARKDHEDANEVQDQGTDHQTTEYR